MSSCHREYINFWFKGGEAKILELIFKKYYLFLFKTGYVQNLASLGLAVLRNSFGISGTPLTSFGGFKVLDVNFYS